MREASAFFEPPLVVCLFASRARLASAPGSHCVAHGVSGPLSRRQSLDAASQAALARPVNILGEIDELMEELEGTITRAGYLFGCSTGRGLTRLPRGP